MIRYSDDLGHCFLSQRDRASVNAKIRRTIRRRNGDNRGFRDPTSLPFAVSTPIVDESILEPHYCRSEIKPYMDPSLAEEEIILQNPVWLGKILRQ